MRRSRVVMVGMTALVGSALAGCVRDVADPAVRGIAA